jgi:hypothetical protein
MMSSEQLDSLARKLVTSIKRDNPNPLQQYFPTVEDAKFILESSKKSMNEKEYAEAEAMLDSIPYLFKKQWKENYIYIFKKIKEYSINFRKIEYLDTQIEYDFDEEMEILLANILARFVYNDIIYSIKFECGKLPRGWILGSKVKLGKILNDKD